MNRLFRQIRRRRRQTVSKAPSTQPNSASQPTSSLTMEQLENRVLLTTLVLPEGETDELVFRYADPEETQPGSDVSVFNEIRIGTYSQFGPEKDVVVEILNYRGENIPGEIGFADDFDQFGLNTTDVFGGVGTGLVDLLGPVPGVESQTFTALATSPTGFTYGIAQSQFGEFNLFRINPNTLQPVYIGEITDADGQSVGTTTANPVTFSNIAAADFDPVSGKLYAIAGSFTRFDSEGIGILDSQQQVMVTIDLSSGEVDPVGQTITSQDSYSLSVVSTLNEPVIHSMVYSQEGADNLNNDGTVPVFVFSQSAPVNSLRTVAVTQNAGTTEVVTLQGQILTLDGDAYLEGLFYGQIEDGTTQLFGTLETGPTDGQLVVWLRGANELQNLVQYGSDETPLSLHGVSFDATRGSNGSGLAISTDGRLYEIVTTNLGFSDEEITITGGVSDVFFMYVASCTADTYIVMTRVEVDLENFEFVYTPNGGEGAYLFTDDDDSDISTPDEAGGVMIGTLPMVREGDDIIWSPGLAGAPDGRSGTFFDSTDQYVPETFMEIGAYPGGAYRPGIVVADDPDAPGTPQDIGLIQVGGGVFGDVDISGSIGRFYCGYLGTNRFEVGGELGQLVVNTQAGGIEESDGSWTCVEDAIVDVRGSLGSIYANGDWGMPVRVRGLADTPEFPGVIDEISGRYVRVHREIEHIGWTEQEAFPDFIHGATNDLVRNDTLESAEFLGALDGKISVTGFLEGYAHFEDDDDDHSDFYSFTLLAGQTVSITFYDVGGVDFGNGQPYNVDSQIVYGDWDEWTPRLYDPEGVIVARWGEQDIATAVQAPMTFTAERSGVYSVAIGSRDPGDWAVIDYRLDIEGVDETTLGGATLRSDMRYLGTRNPNDRVNFQVDRGNLGGIIVGGTMRGGQVRVNDGNLGGILAALGSEEADSTFGFHWEIDDVGASYTLNPTIFVEGTVGEVRSAVNSVLEVHAGVDIHSMVFGNNVHLRAIADRHIGQLVVTGGMSPVMETSSGGTVASTLAYGVFAGADGVGEGGVIERIYCGADWGAAFGYMDEIPVSTGPQGGNVRFVDIRGNVVKTTAGFTTNTFGPFLIPAGQSRTLTDDSGAVMRLSPGFTGEVDDEPLALDPDTDTTGEDADLTPGSLTLKLLPIRDILPTAQAYSDSSLLGYAVAGLVATDGLRVRFENGEEGPIDLGYVQVSGVNDDSVIFTGPAPISVLQLDVETGIQQVINRTKGGDIIALQIQNITATADDTGDDTDDTDEFVITNDLNPDARPVNPGSLPFTLVQVAGHVGSSESVIDHKIETITLVEAVPDPTPDDFGAEINPIGPQRSGIVSLFGINTIRVDGSLGDCNITGGVNLIQLNHDNSDDVGQFDGVAGAILIDGGLNRIELGDGITDPGYGDWALSGVFVRGGLGTAEISGPGNNIGGPIFVDGDIDRILVKDGAKLLGYHGEFTGDRVRGTLFTKPTIATTITFDDFVDNETVLNGVIGRIEVTGQGSEVYGANIYAYGIQRVFVGNGANGMYYSRIDTSVGSSLEIGRIREIIVGGEGIFDTTITANRDIDFLTLLPGAKMEYSQVISSGDIGKIKADEMNHVTIDAINSLDQITLKNECNDIILETGALGRFKANNSIYGSSLLVGGPVDLMQVKGDFISSIKITGPIGNLKKLKVGGDLGTPNGGEIIVDGVVGSITVGGDMLADLQVNWDPTPVSPANPDGPRLKQDINGLVIGKIKVGGDFIGTSDVGGNVGTIQTGGDFGKFRDSFTIHEGDIKTLKVGADLQSSVTVQGQANAITVYGDVRGNLTVEDNLNALKLIGKGSDRADLMADLYVGGNMRTFKIVNGDIAATNVLTGAPLQMSVDGKGPKFVQTGGTDLSGQAQSMATKYVQKGQMVYAPSMEEQEQTGIDPTLAAMAGGASLGALNTGQLQALALDDSTVYFENGTNQWTFDSDFGRSFVATGDVGQLRIQGDLATSGLIVIDGDVDELIIEGDLLGLVHVTGTIGRLQARNVRGDDAQLGSLGVVTAAGSINQIDVAGEVADAYILAGFDPGIASAIENRTFAAMELTIDGTTADSNETALAGSIDKVNIDVLNQSVIAAGVGPGTNIIFGDTDLSDVPGSGLSSIGKVTIGSTEGDGNPFGVFADTDIQLVKVNGRRLPDRVSQADGFRLWTISEPVGPQPVGIPFLQGTPFKGMINGANVTITMTGPGLGQVVLDVNGIETIHLADTTDSTSVKISASGAEITVGNIVNGDDEGLNQLLLNGNLGVDGAIDLGGDVNRLDIGSVAAGGMIQVDGHVNRLSLGDVAGSSSSATSITVVDGIDQLLVDELGAFASIITTEIDKTIVNGNLYGTVQTTQNDMTQVMVKGDLDGVLNSAGDINKLTVKDTVSGKIRAALDINSFTAAAMVQGSITAGRDFDLARIKGDVRFSTIAAALDSGSNADPFSGDDVMAGSGNLNKVLINGDLVQSNIVAGLTPGEDNMFGTADDGLDQRAAENTRPPEVAEVFFPDEFTISVRFVAQPQGRAANINSVIVKGTARGSSLPQTLEQFAIAAAGTVDSVVIDRQAFGGTDNMVRLNVNDKGIQPSSIEQDDINNMIDAAAAAFRVRTDGPDHIFGTADDIYIFNDSNPLTDPTVNVTFDVDTQTASFRKDDGVGFIVNPEDTNYYEITLDGDAVETRTGVPLGDDFVYYFAVGDLGNTAATAFNPFAGSSFPENFRWVQTGMLGNDNSSSAEAFFEDEDFLRLAGLEAGQVVDFSVTNSLFDSDPISQASYGNINVELLRVLDEKQFGQSYTLIGAPGQLGLDPDEDPLRDLVSPQVSVLAYSEGQNQYYAYEDIGQRFYTFNFDSRGYTLLPNTLEELNDLIQSQGRITEITALAGRTGDSLWAVGTFVPATGSASTRLIRLNNLSTDIDDEETQVLPTVVVYPNDLGYDSITGLAQFNDVLYAVDQDTSTIVQLDSVYNAGSLTSGVGTALGTGSGNLKDGDDLLNPTGLSINLNGDGLIVLHDQPAYDESNLLVDALYSVDTSDASTRLFEVLDNGGYDRDRRGLAVEQGAGVLVGLPLLGTIVGDEMTIDIDFGNFSAQSHTFGADQTSFGVGSDLISIDSNTGRVAPNLELQQFVDGGYYYAFDITYQPNAGLGTVTITIDDINWDNELEIGTVVAGVADDENNVFVSGGGDTLQIVIDTEAGLGSTRVYFAGTSQVELLEAVNTQLSGAILGTDSRTDLEPNRDMILGDVADIAVLHDGAILVSQEVSGFFDSVAYDQTQEIFALMNVDTRQTAPILVTDPDDSAETIALTRQVLSDIYNTEVDDTVTIDTINAIEFNPDGSLYLLVSVTDSDATPTTRDSLLRVDNIQDPGSASGMQLALYGMQIDSQNLSITSLAYGNKQLYGIDVTTQTLVEIDGRRTIFSSDNVETNNPFFGAVWALGGNLSNLTDGSETYDITGLAFNDSDRLFAVDNASDMLFEVSLFVKPETHRLSLSKVLSEDNYQDIYFDTGADNTIQLVSAVAGSPLTDQVQLAVGSATAVHTFGSTTSTVGGLTVSSVNNTSTDFNTYGGYYAFDVTYPTGQGLIELSIDDIDWPAGSSGSIDSVILIDQAVLVGDEAVAEIKSFDNDNLTIVIDSSDAKASGSLQILFAASSDVLTAQVDPTVEITEYVDSYSAYGSSRLLSLVPEDGDYIVRVAAQDDSSYFGYYYGYYYGYSDSGDSAISYDMEVMVFDDDNGDFGVETTASGIIYDQIAPNDDPVNIETGSNDIDQDPTNVDSLVNHPDYPLTVTGSLTTGQASQIVISTELTNSMDFDVYTFRLAEGQWINVDIDAEVLYGRDYTYVQAGILNGDLEAISSILGETGRIEVSTDQADPFYDAQAINTMPNHPGVVIDPMVNGIGTYYVVVRGGSYDGDPVPYRLTITTTDVQPIDTPDSQLVYLAFDSYEANYLVDVDGGVGGSTNVAHRPAFDADDFELADMRQGLIDSIAARIESVYRAAGLTADEIEFTTEKPALGTTFTTIIFGGKLEAGLFGLAESIDRDNAERDDMAVVLTEELANAYMSPNNAFGYTSLSEDDATRFDEVVTILGNVGAHELGHILGLEHATELDSDPNNMMGYNDYSEPQEFEERNRYLDFGSGAPAIIGYSNEIDLLLRNIGSGTVMGS